MSQSTPPNVKAASPRSPIAPFCGSVPSTPGIAIPAPGPACPEPEPPPVVPPDVVPPPAPIGREAAGEDPGSEGETTAEADGAGVDPGDPDGPCPGSVDDPGGVVVGTAVGVGPAVVPGRAVGVGIGVDPGAPVGLGVEIGVAVGAGVGFGVGAAVGFGVGVGVGAGVGVGVGEGVATGVLRMDRITGSLNDLLAAQLWLL